jgi:hypothetical protein
MSCVSGGGSKCNRQAGSTYKKHVMRYETIFTRNISITTSSIREGLLLLCVLTKRANR